MSALDSGEGDVSRRSVGATDVPSGGDVAVRAVRCWAGGEWDVSVSSLGVAESPQRP